MTTNDQTPHIPERETLTTEQQIRRRTIRGLIGFGAAALVPFGIWKWIGSAPREAGVPQPLRRALQTNERLANTYFSPRHLAPTFGPDKIGRPIRQNGYDGLRGAFDPAAWRLNVEQPGKPPLVLTLAEVQALPKQDLIFEFKCVEGWSQIQRWAGTRLSDLVEKYDLGRKPGTDEPYAYVGLKTPDAGYYVGLETPAALHPQTLLAYEMDGQPLTNAHGAPLRLIVPTKYGIKNLKRIGTLWFADQPPRDFWAERGYDYHAGL
jgi:hypothetical protein